MKTSPAQPHTSDVVRSGPPLSSGRVASSQSERTNAWQRATEGKDRAATSLELSHNTQKLEVERPLTCDEAAAFVRVHPKTVKRMARTGELPGHFRFGRWFFYASELDAWMRTELHSSGHPCR
jgi:excisionase family DNA binding protein